LFKKRGGVLVKMPQPFNLRVLGKTCPKHVKKFPKKKKEKKAPRALKGKGKQKGGKHSFLFEDWGWKAGWGGV